MTTLVPRAGYRALAARAARLLDPGKQHKAGAGIVPYLARRWTRPSLVWVRNTRRGLGVLDPFTGKGNLTKRGHPGGLLCDRPACRRLPRQRRRRAPAGTVIQLLVQPSAGPVEPSRGPGPVPP